MSPYHLLAQTFPSLHAQEGSVGQVNNGIGCLEGWLAHGIGAQCLYRVLWNHFAKIAAYQVLGSKLGKDERSHLDQPIQIYPVMHVIW